MCDWIKWDARGKPFDGGIEGHLWVEYMMVDGDVWQDFAMDINWGLTEEGGEVIAYRASTAANATQRIVDKLKGI